MTVGFRRITDPDRREELAEEFPKPAKDAQVCGFHVYEGSTQHKCGREWGHYSFHVEYQGENVTAMWLGEAHGNGHGQDERLRTERGFPRDDSAMANRTRWRGAR